MEVVSQIWLCTWSEWKMQIDRNHVKSPKLRRSTCLSAKFCTKENQTMCQCAILMLYLPHQKANSSLLFCGLMQFTSPDSLALFCNKSKQSHQSNIIVFPYWVTKTTNNQKFKISSPVVTTNFMWMSKCLSVIWPWFNTKCLWVAQVLELQV